MEAGEVLTQLQVQQWLDQEDAWMRDTVRRHGWAVQYVLGDACSGPSGCACGGSPGADPPFAYTVGLYGFDHRSCWSPGSASMPRTRCSTSWASAYAGVRGSGLTVPLPSGMQRSRCGSSRSVTTATCRC